MRKIYRILLADDEPIILSGLQSMLNWEEHDCTIAGTARNGEQAWEFIGQYRPDIVICDINMPILTGLELICRCTELFPEIIFLMLTNHENFDMAREALRCHAADYLLKIDLDEEKLAASVARAIDECMKRGRLSRGREADGYEEVSPADLIGKYVKNLLTPGDGDVELALAGLEKRGAASRCAVAELILDPSHIPNIAVFNAKERERLFSFHYKLAEDVARKLFCNVGYVLVSGGSGALLYLWNLDSLELLSRFQAKLSSTLGELSQMQISLLVTELVSGKRLTELQGQLAALRSEFTISPRSMIQYSQFIVRTDYVEAAKRYVESHILERVTVQDVATAIGITPNYLSSLFKRQLRQNFIDYVNATKVKHACMLLRGGQHLVYEISHMLGYDNAYYFTKVFKRYMGVTPTEYQNLAAQE